MQCAQQEPVQNPPDEVLNQVPLPNPPAQVVDPIQPPNPPTQVPGSSTTTWLSSPCTRSDTATTPSSTYT